LIKVVTIQSSPADRSRTPRRRADVHRLAAEIQRSLATWTSDAKLRRSASESPKHNLSRRGLRGTKLVISDAHLGLKAAIAKVFKATWQRCPVHSCETHWPSPVKGTASSCSRSINTIFAQDNADAAEEQRDDVLAFMRFPKPHRTQLASPRPTRSSASTPRSNDAPTSCGYDWHRVIARSSPCFIY
jgi:transposase-like protein